MNYILRIIASVLFASVIGWEREKVHKSAGIRTVCFISLAACLTMVFTEELGLTGGSFDKLRLVSYLVAALGFVGSGCITKDEDGVHGLTTAAMLLPVAFIGFFCGMERYFLAWITMTIVYGCLMLSYLTKK